MSAAPEVVRHDDGDALAALQAAAGHPTFGPGDAVAALGGHLLPTDLAQGATQPTGTVVDQAAIDRFMARVPEHVVVAFPVTS